MASLLMDEGAGLSSREERGLTLLKARYEDGSDEEGFGGFGSEEEYGGTNGSLKSKS